MIKEDRKDKKTNVVPLHGCVVIKGGVRGGGFPKSNPPLQ